MSDERTLAGEVYDIFQKLARDPNRYMKAAVSELGEVEVGSAEYHALLTSVLSKCDQLLQDIEASGLRQNSKNLYLGAVQTLTNYLSIESLNSITNSNLKAEKQAFEYLILVDDYLRPLDNRDMPSGFLEGLRDQAMAMLDALTLSGLDLRLRAFLEKQIREFIWTINTFDLLGIEGLSKAWGAMAAEVARGQGMQGAHSPEAKAWYSKALPILGAIGLAVTSVSATVEKVDNTLTHGGNIVKLLTGGDDAEKANDDQSEGKADGQPKAANSK